MTARKLGRRNPGPAAHAVPRLALRERVPHLGTPPANMAWDSAVRGAFDALGNNDYGDCAVVAPAQLARIATACAGAEKHPTLSAVLGTYSAISGWSPDNPNSDVGCVQSDVLARWKGVGLDFGFGAPDRILGYVALNPLDLDELRWAITWFGGVYLGYNLPAVAVGDDLVWSTDASPQGLEIVGGHATAAAAYGPDGFTNVTWGEIRLATPAFMTRFCAEAYAVVMQDWRLPSGMTPSGLSADQVQADVRALAAAAA